VSSRFFPALAVAAAAIAFGASPALAATGCTAPAPPSSVNVYVEQLPTSGSCPKKKPVHHSSAPTSAPITYPVQPTVTVPPKVKTKAKHPTVRKNPVRKPVATVHVVKASAPTSPPPSAVSAAFDLGSGPTALFAALLAAAALLAVGGGLRHGRRR